jgi:hypothetical protein
MGEYLIGIEEDFEYLTTTSMEWKSEVWSDQVEDGRFTFNQKDWQFTNIYWFDNYPAVIAAKSILRELGEDFKVSADDWSSDWAIITTYKSNAWKGL